MYANHLFPLQAAKNFFSYHRTLCLHRIRGKLALFFDQDLFQIVLTILIIANAVLIGVDTDARDYIQHSNPTASQALSFLDTFFTLIFTLEIGLKLFAFGCKEFWVRLFSKQCTHARAPVDTNPIIL